jgi:hypothetical protein
MIFSCLVDADFLDTEAFYAAVDGRQIDRTWPQLSDKIAQMIVCLDAHMAEKRRTSVDSTLNRLRGEILIHVRQKAGLPRGVFTLNVPTGGGKTLASLAFALDHAKHWKMDRIVYAIPFTSIIEQTASIFRGILGEDVILEHHSSIEDRRIRRRCASPACPGAAVLRRRKDHRWEARAHWPRPKPAGRAAGSPARARFATDRRWTPRPGGPVR